MIRITDQQLTDPATGGAPLFAAVYLILQAELEVAVFAGTGTVVVSWGDALADYAGEPPPAADLDPIVNEGLIDFEGVVTDLYSSRIYASWTTEHGGALRLRMMFEEEGVEVRGGAADVDFDHLQLDVFLVPSLDETNTVVWDVELGFFTDGGLISDAVRGLIEREVLNGAIVELIAEGLSGFTDQLNLLLDLPAERIVSIDIDEGEALFDNLVAGDRLIDVIFDAVEVHDDGDRSGQGELRFTANVAGIDTGPSEAVPAASGTVVPLEGTEWRTSLTVAEGTSVSAQFAVLDADGDTLQSLGTVNVDLDPDDAPRALQLSPANGNFTVLMRLEERGADRPPDTRHLRVTVPSVQLLHDQDNLGKGEVQFWALAADQPTAVSVEQKVKGAGNPDVDLGSQLEVELYLPDAADLEVRVIGWDNDPSQRDWMGEVRLLVPSAAIGEATREITSDTGDFVATIGVADLDQPEDGTDGQPDEGGDEEPVETVTRLIVFDSLTVDHDGDTFFAGEILATAQANGVAFGNAGEPIDVSSGTELALVGGEWSATVQVPVDETLVLSAEVIDVDGRVDDDKQHNDDLMGRATLTFDAGDDWGLGPHAMSDSDGDFTFRVRILDPAAQTGELGVTVRFEEVEILHDHTTFGAGAFWSIGSVNGFPVGNSDRFEAGRGDAIVLDERDWSHQLSIDAADPLAISFQVIEADDNDHVSLGTATARLTYPWPEGVQEATSDEGDFILRYSVFDSVQAGADRLSVSFLEVTPLKDGDGLSEGELRFAATANTEQSGLSALQKARSGETLPLVGDPWTLEPRLDAGDELTVTFSMYDEDGDALRLVDRVEERFSLAEEWGLGEHVITSPDEQFRVRFAVAGADADSLPDLPDRTPLLLEFVDVEIHDDGDNIDRGEITFEGTAAGETVLQTGEYKVASGDTVALGGPLAPRTIWVAPDADLEIALTASEHDGGGADVLGTSRHTHAAANGWELGLTEVTSPGGAITARWRVDRADGPRVRVKFLHVHVFDDEEPVGAGSMVCEGSVNGISTGPSLPMKAGRDGGSTDDDLKSDIYIGGPKWNKVVSYDPDDPRLDIAFTVTELDGLSRDDLLGTVRFDGEENEVFASLSPFALHTVEADSGRYVLTFMTQRLS
jgi:hypothetical protein